MPTLGLHNLDLKKLNIQELQLLSRTLDCGFTGTNKASLCETLFEKLNAMSEGVVAAQSSNPVVDALGEFKDEIIAQVKFASEESMHSIIDFIQDKVVKSLHTKSAHKDSDGSIESEKSAHKDSDAEEEEEEESEECDDDECVDDECVDEDECISFNVQWYVIDKNKTHSIDLVMKQTATVAALQLILMNRFGVHPNEMCLELANETGHNLAVLSRGSLVENGVENGSTVLFGLVGFDDDDDDDSVINEPVPFDIFVKWDKNSKVSVFKETTVEDLQAVLLDKGLDGGLEFAGKRLEADQTLQFYGIQRNKTLNLVKALKGGGGKATVKKDILKKVAQLKGGAVPGPITDDEMVKAMQDSRKTLGTTSITFDTLIGACNADQIKEMLEFCNHNKTPNDKKFMMFHEFLGEVRSIQKGLGHFEYALDHAKDVVYNAFLLKFVKKNGSLSMQDVVKELEILLRVMPKSSGSNSNKNNNNDMKD